MRIYRFKWYSTVANRIPRCWTKVNEIFCFVSVHFVHYHWLYRWTILVLVASANFVSSTKLFQKKLEWKWKVIIHMTVTHSVNRPMWPDLANILPLGYFRLLFTQPIFTQTRKAHGIVRILRFRMWFDVDVLDLQSFNVDILANFWPLFHNNLAKFVSIFWSHCNRQRKVIRLNCQMAMVGP